MVNLNISHFIKITCYELKLQNAMIIRDVIAKMLTICKTCKVDSHKFMDYPGQYLLRCKDRHPPGLSSLTNMSHDVYTPWDLVQIGFPSNNLHSYHIEIHSCCRYAVKSFEANIWRWTRQMSCNVSTFKNALNPIFMENNDSQLEAENNSSK